MNFITFSLCILLASSGWGAETTKAKLPQPEVTKKANDIEDNSFLLEEAFNQEDGVEQHIQSLQYLRDGSLLYLFTEESPVGGRKHQLSVTVPLIRTPTESGGRGGMGDIGVNYRYQLVDQEGFLVSPRFSLLLPSGNYVIGTGSGAMGYQVNLPVSYKLNSYLISHWNLGATYTPARQILYGDSNWQGSYNSLAVNYGGSFIWLMHPKFNFMFEVAGLTDQVLDDEGAVKNSTLVYLNPGVRYAFDFDSGLQIVPGLSFPIGAATAAGNNGVLTYLSFEHPMF